MVLVTGLKALPKAKKIPKVMRRAQITLHTPMYISRGFDLNQVRSTIIFRLERFSSLTSSE